MAIYILNNFVLEFFKPRKSFSKILNIFTNL